MNILEAVHLPWPPSVNHYWKAGRSFRTNKPNRYLSTKASEFREAVKLLCGRSQPCTGRIGIRADVYPPDRRTRDLDNLLKGILDSITAAGVILDDCQIDEICMSRKAVHKGGMVVVWLWELKQG